MMQATHEQDKPKVSIGLPVYNGERYLEKALDSILDQTFGDFELIISDNASEDRTEAICREYALKDPRICYHRNAKNIGGSKNHNLVFSLARGIYFRFAAYDDACAPEFLSECVEALDENPGAVLSYAITVQIDEDGCPFKEIDQKKATSPLPYERFRDLTGWDHDCEPIYGLIRSDVLADISRKTGLLLSYTDSDRALLCQLSLYGQFYQVPKPLFYKRIHPKMSTKLFPDWRKRMAWSFPKGAEPITFPHWQQFFHYLRVIKTAPITAHERRSCYWHMVQWLFMERRWGKMIKDLYYAGRKFSQHPTLKWIYE